MSLPEKAYYSAGYFTANAAARDSFENVVHGPGYIFPSSGRYRNIENLDDIYNVEPGQVVPAGIYLIGDNYLVVIQ